MKYFVGALSTFVLAGLLWASFALGKHRGEMLGVDRVKPTQLSLPRDADPYLEFGGRKISNDDTGNNLRGLLADPQFAKLPPLEQRAAMAEISGDNKFRELSDDDTAQFISEIRQSSIVRATLQCGKKARAAYGRDYEDMDDYTLGRLVLAKYPGCKLP
jgi:hypothetical protein